MGFLPSIFKEYKSITGDVLFNLKYCIIRFAISPDIVLDDSGKSEAFTELKKLTGVGELVSL